MRLFQRVGKWAVYSFFGVVATLVALNVWVVRSTQALVFPSAAHIPEQPVGLVLGTSNKTTSGRPNLFFENRIATAAELFHKKKIRRIIVSGDNQSSPYYNEPLHMKKALIARGVPAEAIAVDDAGVRTLDSIVRCQSVFGESHIIIITQRFHGYRALFISRYYRINARVLAAPGIPFPQVGPRVYLREFFARAQAVFDLFVFNTRPVSLSGG